MRSLVIHPHDPAYALRVAADLAARDERSSLHPAAGAPDDEIAYRVADRWLDVTDLLVVYCDRGMTPMLSETVRIAEALGLGIEYRCVGNVRPTWRDRVRGWLS